MLLGLVADIHEDVENLERVLAEFQRRGVECVVNLGDACDTYSDCGRSREVVALLRAANAVGVWGNHDVGLCNVLFEHFRHEAVPEVLEFMGRMQPQLVIEDCRFSHVEPWLNPYRVEDLWYLDGPPDTDNAARSFAAVPERVLFLGHFHRWLVVTPSGRVAWNGREPIELAKAERYLIVIAPVFGGWCATFDTQQSVLTPVHCDGGCTS